MVQDYLSESRREYDLHGGQVFASRHTASLPLDNRSCVVLLPSIHGHMNCPNKSNPCNDAISAHPTSVQVVSQRVVDGYTQFMSRIKANQAV